VEFEEYSKENTRRIECQIFSDTAIFTSLSPNLFFFPVYSFEYQDNFNNINKVSSKTRGFSKISLLLPGNTANNSIKIYYDGFEWKKISE
jgi:hypothetical protein